ncbi:MAG: tRNA-dihydrouridine synthase [Candidatus Pacebacteria bacterium]|nr:tRNA-dihydrouridine synthase [Candidatus Paceibacterota bacterium]
MKNFWKELKKPIMVLAPMADVTDCVFREIINKYGKPDVFWTEFVSVDGLCSPGKERLLIDLKYDKAEHPIVAQIFGSKPENFEKVAKMLVEMGFDGIDINMGCPVKKVLNQNSCSALIRTPELAKEIILATKRGAGNIPVSVKTRIGFSKVELETWIPAILETSPAVLTVHLRTVKEMSLVPAHWELMKRVVEIRDEMKSDTLIFGNGDVLDLKDAQLKVAETGCDGIMLGRAIFGNPWLFTGKVPTLEEKLKVMIEHTKLFEKVLSPHKNFALMKKHYKAYVNNFDGAKELRVKLMEAENATEIENITNDFLKTLE